MRLFLLTLSLLLLANVHGQRKDLYVFGDVQDQFTTERLQGVIVEAIDVADTTQVIHADVKKNGKYEMYIPLDERSYRLVFTADHHPGKHVIIDLRGVPAPAQRRGLGMELKVLLFRHIPNIDLSALNEPIGKSHYDPATKEFTWDMEYMALIRPRFEDLMNAYRSSLQATH